MRQVLICLTVIITYVIAEAPYPAARESREDLVSQGAKGKTIRIIKEVRQPPRHKTLQIIRQHPPEVQTLQYLQQQPAPPPLLRTIQLLHQQPPPPPEVYSYNIIKQHPPPPPIVNTVSVVRQPSAVVVAQAIPFVQESVYQQTSVGAAPVPEPWWDRKK